MAATSVVDRQPERGMAPTEYRCPICQEASKSFRSLLHHVQWWHGFCRDGPATQQPRGEEESIPNYDLVRKRDAYLREQGKLRAKVDKFFHCTESGMKFNRRTEKPRFRCREGPPPAVVYEEFWPHTTSKEAPDPGYTAVDPRDVGSQNNYGVTERATEASTYESSEPFATTEAAKNAVDYVNHRVQVKAATRATQTDPRPTRHAEKHRVTFAPDDSAMVQPKPPRRPPRCTRRVEKFLESIIKYLSIEDLLVCRQVCRAWKRIIERPQHWLHIDLKHTTISAQIFSEMASWCSAVQSISLEALEVAFGDLNQEPMNSRVHLEHGLENLLRACCKTLKVLTIIGCDNVLTDRILWLASACPFLEVVAYVTVSHVTLPEALWSLGAGCRRVKTLIVPPLDPLHKLAITCDACQHIDARRIRVPLMSGAKCLTKNATESERYSRRDQQDIFIKKKQGYAGHRVCQMLGKCWPELQVLCIGGRNLTLASICCILRSCMNLTSLEIDRGRDIDESSAAVLVEAGLPRIQHLYLTHTVISPGAVIIMHGCCPRLKRIDLVLHRRDFGLASDLDNFVAGFGALQQREPFDTFVRLSFTDDRSDLAEDIE